MTPALKLRLVGFLGGILIVAVLTIWAANTTWNQAAALGDRLTREQIESFQTADQFRAYLQELDYTLLRFAVGREQADWERFQTESRKLDQWIDEQTLLLTSPEEKRTLGAINTAYDGYQLASRNLSKRFSETPGSQVQVGDLAKVELESGHLMDLGFQLVRAHHESLSQFIGQSKSTLHRLQVIIFTSLSALIVLGGLLMWVVYREMIMPLQLQLVETAAVLERQEKLASLGVLATGVAHEIRNPLTAIKARLFSHQKGFAPDSKEYQDALVIGGEINRLERIVKDFLQFARPADPQIEEMPAEAPLRDVMELLRPQLQRQGVTISLDVGAVSCVMADRAQIKQVLINLVQNAAESIDGGGAIILRVREGQQRLGGRMRPVVILEVADSGKGITPEVQKRLFDPFFTTKESGTGLGLAIAARIVERHGGALEFQTQVNHGTVFGVVLPKEKKK